MELIKAYLEELERTEIPDEDVGSHWAVPNSPYEYSCTRCTSSAMLIATKFSGKVFGYELEMEETLTIGSESGGHDFAVVGDYLVDYWAAYVSCCLPKPGILHLTQDIEIIKARYLPRDQWEELKLWESK